MQIHSNCSYYCIHSNYCLHTRSFAFVKEKPVNVCLVTNCQVEVMVAYQTTKWFIYWLIYNPYSILIKAHGCVPCSQEKRTEHSALFMQTKIMPISHSCTIQLISIKFIHYVLYIYTTSHTKFERSHDTSLWDIHS